MQPCLIQTDDIQTLNYSPHYHKIEWNFTLWRTTLIPTTTKNRSWNIQNAKVIDPQHLSWFWLNDIAAQSLETNILPLLATMFLYSYKSEPSLLEKLLENINLQSISGVALCSANYWPTFQWVLTPLLSQWTSRWENYKM